MRFRSTLSIVAALVLLTAPTPLIPVAQAQPTTRRVNAISATDGSGATWQTAYHKLQNAIAASAAGDTIWIAEGLYKPGASQTSRYNIPHRLRILGGFPDDLSGPGSENDREEALYSLTILSGDIDNNDNRDADNAHHVIYIDCTGSA